MIEKLKNFAQTVGDFLVWVVTPLAFIAGYVYYLLGKNRALQDKVDEKDRDVRANQDQARIEGDEKDVEEALGRYNAARDAANKPSEGG